MCKLGAPLGFEFLSGAPLLFPMMKDAGIIVEIVDAEGE